MNLAEALKLKYPVTLVPAEEDGFVAKIPDLPGCITQGETLDEALVMIEDAKAAWLEDALESGEEIPLPNSRYSGKFLVRTPKSLHGRLAQCAETEGVSLNSYVVSVLSKAVG